MPLRFVWYTRPLNPFHASTPFFSQPSKLYAKLLTSPRPSPRYDYVCWPYRDISDQKYLTPNNNNNNNNKPRVMRPRELSRQFLWLAVLWLHISLLSLKISNGSCIGSAISNKPGTVHWFPLKENIYSGGQIPVFIESEGKLSYFESSLCHWTSLWDILV